MDPQLTQLIEAQQQKIDAIYKSVEKTRKYLLWTMIATVAFFVLPIIGLLFVVPSFISSYTSSLNEVGL
jgi:TRAP-type mannitol/chloroaromatic compound transport system permease small subunit